MDEVGFLTVNMRKALTKAYCMDYDVFVEIMHDGEENAYTMSKWKMMQDDFQKWFCYIDNHNASKFCYWVLYSEDI